MEHARVQIDVLESKGCQGVPLLEVVRWTGHLERLRIQVTHWPGVIVGPLVPLVLESLLSSVVLITSTRLRHVQRGSIFSLVKHSSLVLSREVGLDGWLSGLGSGRLPYVSPIRRNRSSDEGWLRRGSDRASLLRVYRRTLDVSIVVLRH